MVLVIELAVNINAKETSKPSPKTTPAVIKTCCMVIGFITVYILSYFSKSVKTSTACCTGTASPACANES